jgi:hypothetical protein
MLRLSEQSTEDALGVVHHCMADLTDGFNARELDFDAKLVARVETAGVGLDVCGRVLRALVFKREMPVDDGVIGLLEMAERFWLDCIETDRGEHPCTDGEGLVRDKDVAHDELELEKVRGLQRLVANAKGGGVRVDA